MPTETAHQSIAYEDVIDLLDIDHPESWDDNAIYPPYILKLDGIYAKPAYRLRGLSQEELSALRPWFPPGYYGNYSKPVLALPCMSQDFVEFIAGAELWDRVMYPSGEFIEAWREHGLPDCDTSAKPKAALNMPASETLLPEAGPEPFRFKTQRDRSGYTDMARELAERFYRETGRNATASGPASSQTRLTGIPSQPIGTRPFAM